MRLLAAIGFADSRRMIGDSNGPDRSNGIGKPAGAPCRRPAHGKRARQPSMNLRRPSFLVGTAVSQSPFSSATSHAGERRSNTPVAWMRLPTSNGRRPARCAGPAGGGPSVRGGRMTRFDRPPIANGRAGIRRALAGSATNADASGPNGVSCTAHPAADAGVAMGRGRRRTRPHSGAGRRSSEGRARPLRRSRHGGIAGRDGCCRVRCRSWDARSSGRTVGGARKTGTAGRSSAATGVSPNLARGVG